MADQMKAKFLAIIALIPVFAFTAPAQTTNSWTDGSSKWEMGGNWSAGTPSSADAANLITNPSTKTVTIDATTTNAVNIASMTVSNLMVSAPLDSTNTLFLNNAGLVTPLDVLNGFTVTTNGALIVTNSALRVDGLSGGLFSIDGSVVLNGTGSMASTNAPTIIGNSSSGQVVISNGTWLAGGVMLGNSAGSQGTLTIVGGVVSLQALNVGAADCSGTGTVVISGGTLYVTNATHDAVLDVRKGTVIVAGGSVVVDELVVTNSCYYSNDGLFIHTGGTLSITSTNLAPDLSAAGDDIPNGWKQQYGLDPFDPNLDGKDLDGTGFTVLQDYLADLDPTNSASVFCITAIDREGNDIRVTWNCVGNLFYIIQTNSPAASGSYINNFTDLSGLIVAPAGVTNTSYLDSGGATNKPARYYRVLLYQGPI
jgi:hypothetical protein